METPNKGLWNKGQETFADLIHFSRSSRRLLGVSTVQGLYLDQIFQTVSITLHKPIFDQVWWLYHLHDCTWFRAKCPVLIEKIFFFLIFCYSWSIAWLPTSDSAELSCELENRYVCKNVTAAVGSIVPKVENSCSVNAEILTFFRFKPRSRFPIQLFACSFA